MSDAPSPPNTSSRPRAAQQVEDVLRAAQTSDWGRGGWLTALNIRNVLYNRDGIDLSSAQVRRVLGSLTVDRRRSRTGLTEYRLLPEKSGIPSIDETDPLRAAAMWVVLNWDARRTQHGSMPDLREALGLPREPPTREEAERRINEYIGAEVTP